MTIEEFFGTLQESITTEWRKHLQTGKYSKHMCLDEYYKEMPEKIDALIEAWQADNDVVKDYKNILSDDMDALEYMQALKKHTKEGRELLGSSELESLCDDILTLIDSTIYKLKHLKESLMPLTEFLAESLLDDNFDIKDADILLGKVQEFCDHLKPSGGNRYGNVDTEWYDNEFTDSFQKLIREFPKYSAAKFKKEIDSSSFIVVKAPKYISEFVKGHFDFYVVMPDKLENGRLSNIHGVEIRVCPAFISFPDAKGLTSARGCAWVEQYKIPNKLANEICRICDSSFRK